MTGYGVDLVDELRARRLPRAYGMERVVDALWDAVHRPAGTRSAVLLGPSGAGKSAAVAELVRRLVEREPGEEWRVLRVGGGDFLRGTKYLGEWETRALALIDEIKRPAKVVLHVPDLAVLHSVGKAEKSDSNVAAVFAPFLETGEVCLVGEATPEEFAGGLGSVPTLRRPFQPITVEAPEAPETLAIVERVADDLLADGSAGELFEGVERASEGVPKATLERIVDLADLYGSSVAQPARSIELLRRALDACEERPLEPRHVLDALSRTSGLPTELLDDDQPLDLNQLADFFTRRVMGQPEAVDAVRDVVTLVKAGLNDPRRPLGVMLFVGPTGVGKTELARSLAEYLFGSPDRLLRFDLSEYASYQSYERLIGTRDGGDGLLTRVVRERPFSVVLLDEIEKAHQNVFDLCLQLFDAGRLTDGAGRTVDFRRTIVILTSNVGSAVKTERTVGFQAQSGPEAPEVDDVRRELERFFRPEFLNRIDRIVHFRPLDLETAERIARRELHAVLGRSGIVRRGLQVDVDQGLVQFLLERGYSAAFGARPLERTVSRHVLLPLAKVLARSPHLGDEVVHLSAKHGEVIVRLVRDVDDDEGEPRLVKVPRNAGGGPDEPKTLAEARAGAAGVVEAADLLDGRCAALHALREALVVESSAGDFWNDRPRALARLDLLHRCDALLSEVKGFGERSRRLAERTLRASRARDALSAIDAVEEYEHRARQLGHLLDLDPERGLSDALVVLTSVRDGRGPSLDGVARVGRMFSAWAERRGYAVSVLHDRSGGEPFEDGAVLAVDGPGAFALLATESGMHRFRGWAHKDAGGPRDTVRELVRVEVLETPAAGLQFEGEVRFETHSLRDPRGRFDARPRLAVTLVHPASHGRAEFWFPGGLDEVEERLHPLFAARLARPAQAGDDSHRIIRRYDFAPEARVRDTATQTAHGRVSRVLEGDLDGYLLPPNLGG